LGFRRSVSYYSWMAGGIEAIDEDAVVESARRGGSESLDAFAESRDVIALLACNGVLLAINRPFTADAKVGRSFVELIAPADAEAMRAALERVRDGGAPTKLDVGVPVPGGSPACYQVSVAPVHQSGRVAALAIVAAEITLRKETEARLRRAEALLVDAEGTAHLGTWEWDVRQPNAVWSDELYRIYALTPQEYTPSYEAYLEKVHPDDRAHVIAATEQVFRKHEPYSHDERIRRPDGSIRYLHTWAHAILDEDGKLARLIGVCQDITDRKLVEIALEQRAAELARSNELLRAEMAERARIEQLLSRSQKLEAIGRLAGGIAHDFNNMLSVVSGYTGIMLSREPTDSRSRKHLGEIMNAVNQATRMTQQLLAFGREQVIERGPIDLDRVVVDMTQLLRRLIGEDVELSQVIGTDRASPIYVDANRSQIEQVIVNLVVNARDAMPGGGRLTVTTTAVDIDADDAPTPELEAGAYVCLAVRDTGVGMSEDVQAQIFDPFFTTKEEGKGTGLGLSIVYGIIKQSGGAITVCSTVGEGTRIAVYFKRVDPDSAPARRSAPRNRPARGAETVLLVEDQAAVRAVVREALESFGYLVLEAGCPIEALRLASEYEGGIDALLTDAVMPKMSGRELAERLVAERPAMRVLYMSGHTRDVMLRQGVSAGAVAFLSKPFTPSELADRLRALLDE